MFDADCHRVLQGSVWLVPSRSTLRSAATAPAHARAKDPTFDHADICSHSRHSLPTTQPQPDVCALAAALVPTLNSCQQSERTSRRSVLCKQLSSFPASCAGAKGGYTPLHYAARQGRAAMAELLLQHGAPSRPCPTVQQSCTNFRSCGTHFSRCMLCEGAALHTRREACCCARWLARL